MKLSLSITWRMLTFKSPRNFWRTSRLSILHRKLIQIILTLINLKMLLKHQEGLVLINDDFVTFQIILSIIWLLFISIYFIIINMNTLVPLPLEKHASAVDGIPSAPLIQRNIGGCAPTVNLTNPHKNRLLMVKS